MVASTSAFLASDRDSRRWYERRLLGLIRNRFLTIVAPIRIWKVSCRFAPYNHLSNRERRLSFGVGFVHHRFDATAQQGLPSIEITALL